MFKFQISQIVIFVLVLTVVDSKKASKIGKPVKKGNSYSHSRRQAVVPPTCPQGSFACPDRCIDQKWVCDGENDCTNGADELNCSPGCAAPNKFLCRNGNCITGTYKCDHDNDCGDMSDETGCPPSTCPSREFSCTNGLCVGTAWICDGDDDCGDNSDESNCPPSSCHTGYFKCANVSKCIPPSYVCDGDKDCLDNSDETGCTCGTDQFGCTGGGCVPQSYRCDGDDDCNDWSDEKGCPALHPGACGDKMSYADCAHMNTTTYPICLEYPDAFAYCRKYCKLCDGN